MNNVHKKVFPVNCGRICRKIKKKKHKKSRKEEEGKEETTPSSCAKELTKVVINLRGISKRKSVSEKRKKRKKIPLKVG